MPNQLVKSHLKIHFFIICAAVLIVCSVLLPNGRVLAQNGFPEPIDQYINDFANIITPSDAAEITQLFQTLEAEHGIQATVVTIHALNDYPVGHDTIEGFATDLFNTWGIGNRESNDGVLILVSVDDRLMRIELGEGYGNFYNSDMDEVINEFMIPRFREGNFSLGLRRGAMATIGMLTGEWPDEINEPTAAVSSPASAVPSATTSTTTSIWASFWQWLTNFGPIGGITALVLLFTGGRQAVTSYLRYRPRNCPDCGTPMTRLDEQSDDLYLDSGQKLEEYLQTVDYDIWQCPACHEHQLHRYAKFFGSHSKCPSCSYRTVKSSSRTLVAATYSSTGRKEVTKDCQHCDYYDVQTVTIPRKQRSSSSSGSSFSSSSSRSSRSSFGGGRSSGGGSSGRW